MFRKVTSSVQWLWELHISSQTDMPATAVGPLTIGSSTFEPDELFARWASGDHPLPEDNNLRSSLRKTFNLGQNDSYVYHAIASVTLSEVQQAIEHGGEGGLHAWYRDDEAKAVRIEHSTEKDTTLMI